MSGKKIAGIPVEALEAHHAKVLEMKRQGFDLALGIARMTEEERRHTGFKDAGHALLYTAKDIEKLTLALEKKYPDET